MSRVFGLVGTGLRVLFTEGPLSFLRRVRKKARSGILGKVVELPVAFSDALNADWTQPREPTDRIVVKSGPIDIAWVMSPPSPTSGGHQNLLRFIDYAERAGHRCTIHFYTSTGVVVDTAEMTRMLASNPAYPTIGAPMTMYDPVRGVEDRAQAIFATGWETAYPVYLDRSNARRFYFVQDLESSFYPAGTQATLADNTYRFGFHGLTAGRWLATKLHDDFGMATDYFDFAVDKTRYSLVNRERRNEIFFYARPPTERRGFELGVLALVDFARHRPDVTINFAGWDVRNWNLPFAFKNHAGLRIDKLNDLYNRCAAGLVLSMSNLSLLPLELMSSGVAPVINDAPNNRLVVDSEYIAYVPPSPLAISRALREQLEREDQVDRSAAMSASVANLDWEESGRQFVRAFERAMRG